MNLQRAKKHHPKHPPVFMQKNFLLFIIFLLVSACQSASTPTAELPGPVVQVITPTGTPGVAPSRTSLLPARKAFGLPVRCADRHGLGQIIQFGCQEADNSQTLAARLHVALAQLPARQQVFWRLARFVPGHPRTSRLRLAAPGFAAAPAAIAILAGLKVVIQILFHGKFHRLSWQRSHPNGYRGVIAAKNIIPPTRPRPLASLFRQG